MENAYPFKDKNEYTCLKFLNGKTMLTISFTPNP